MKFDREKVMIHYHSGVEDQCVCEIEEDGSVTFKEDASIEQIKWALGYALREIQFQKKYRHSTFCCTLEEEQAARQELNEINSKAARNSALNEMSRLSQEMGLYDEPSFKCSKCRCPLNCICCKEGHCGCSEDKIEIDESVLF